MNTLFILDWQLVVSLVWLVCGRRAQRRMLRHALTTKLRGGGIQTPEWRADAVHKWTIGVYGAIAALVVLEAPILGLMMWNTAGWFLTLTLVVAGRRAR